MKFIIHIFSHTVVLHMDKAELNNLHKLNLNACKLLDGQERYDYIDDLLIDYKFSVLTDAPREHQRLLRELFSKLVKTVGH